MPWGHGQAEFPFFGPVAHDGLLQIKRLRDPGMSLAHITELEESTDTFTDTVRTLDAELAASIEHQQDIRAELAHLMQQGSEGAPWLNVGAM